LLLLLGAARTITMTTRKFTGLEEELHEAAVRHTGFDAFGDPAYRVGLRVLLDAFDADLDLSETGWRLAYEAWFLTPLIARLYAEKGWAEHPEVLAMAIQRPLVITGIPRTGTTALHKLLSVDPQFQGLEYWLTQTPMLRPPRETWETHPAYRACIANLEAVATIVPEMRKAHEFAAGEVEECGAVLGQSFIFSGIHLLPTYRRWCLAQSAQESYRRYVNVLHLIGGREPQKRWLLKAPHHMVEIDTLLEVFPDACIIQTHRDPLKAIPSFCSLLHTYERAFQGEAARADVLGPQECAFWRNALDRMETARKKLPVQFFDVDHRHFLVDPLGTVHSIYEYFGLRLSPHTEQQMRAWVAASPTSRHGEHQYRLDSWGITAAKICESFAEYRAQHQFI
jgi:hypothetical protein